VASRDRLESCIGSARVRVLSPIFASPLRNDGADISDFKPFNPTSAAYAELIEDDRRGAPAGIRVLLDLLLTTPATTTRVRGVPPQPDGPYGDYYVWHDSDPPYADAACRASTPITPPDVRPVRKQYYCTGSVPPSRT